MDRAPEMQPSGVAYDVLSQLNRIQAYIIPGEKLMAVYDCQGGGTGFVGVTDRRVIFYDQAFLTKHKAMVSIAYNHVIAVASTDEGMVFKSGEITLVTAAGNYTFRFRGSEKAHWVYSYIISQLVNQATPQLAG